MTNPFNFDAAFERDLPDNHNEISARKVKIQTKIRFENKMKKEKVEKLITELPKKTNQFILSQMELLIILH